jgi:23S rRNA G2445 N2-methylase RlmL
MTRIFALTTRGLEAVSAREMAALPGSTITVTGYRRIAAHWAGELTPLLGLRTIDDVFLDLATWTGVAHTRGALADLRERSASLDMPSALAELAALRPLRQPPSFSVTASFVGKRNYNAEEIKQAVCDGLQSRYGWDYRPDESAADLNIRIFIEHDTAYVGLRLADHPQHARPYKRAHLPGSTKPSVAAALLLLAGVQPGMTLLDPCCGAGTLLIEAALAGAAVIGGDLDLTALAAAATNAATAGIDAGLHQWDVRRLPLASASVDVVVSNLPWGRQVLLNTSPERFYREVLGEVSRVLRPGGAAALLTDSPALLAHPHLEPLEQVAISLFGQTPTIVICQRAL